MFGNPRKNPYLCLMKKPFSFKEEREIENHVESGMGEYMNYLKEVESKSDELGHSHGPGVQKEVGKILSEKYDVKNILNKNGTKRKRAFADNIIEGFFNNVKFTSTDKGNPNLCSMNRMIKHVLEECNSEYYVTIVKYLVNLKNWEVQFVNILQFIDCLTYDSGTGQIMISQKNFEIEYKKYLKGERKSKEFNIIYDELFNMAVNKRKSHIVLKTKQLDNFINKFNRK
jgi:hypothetical protein